MGQASQQPTPDYYARLEITSSATLEQIKHAYRRLVRLYHPDVNNSTHDARIKQLNEAYAILSDAARRAAYDKLRRDQQRAEMIADMIRRQRQETAFVPSIPKMTWPQGIAGFFRELKKGLSDS